MTINCLFCKLYNCLIYCHHFKAKRSSIVVYIFISSTFSGTSFLLFLNIIYYIILFLCIFLGVIHWICSCYMKNCPVFLDIYIYIYIMLFKNEFCNTTLVVFFFNENITKNPTSFVGGTREWGRRERTAANARSDIPSSTAKIVINDDVVLCHLW